MGLKSLLINRHPIARHGRVCKCLVRVVIVKPFGKVVKGVRPNINPLYICWKLSGGYFLQTAKTDVKCLRL